MPDADKVHAGLGYEHQHIYRQICEDTLSPSEIAHAELETMRRLLQRYGKAPLLLIQQAVNLINSIPVEPILRPTVNWASELNKLEKLGQQISQQTSTAHKRAMAIAMDACKDQLFEVQQGHMPANLGVAMHYQYMLRVYESDFEDRIQLAQHYNNASHQLVNERVRAMRPHIERGLQRFAEQAARQGNLERLRRPPRPVARPIQINDDLLNLGAIA